MVRQQTRHEEDSRVNTVCPILGAARFCALRAAVCLRKSLQLDASDQIVLDAFHETAETLLHENNLAAAEACWQKSLELDRSQVGVLERALGAGG